MNRENHIREMSDLIYENRPIKDIWNEEAESIAETLYNADYRKQEWISVDERLPETRETILYFNGEWVDACYFDGDTFMTLDTYESSIVDDVTHWMPLPEAPKMKGCAE